MMRWSRSLEDSRRRPPAKPSCPWRLPHTRVTMAQRVEAGAFVAPAPPPVPVQPSFNRMPAFCPVAATVRPVADSEIKMEVWLPSEGWNGKFVGVGNGALDGFRGPHA